MTFGKIRSRDGQLGPEQGTEHTMEGRGLLGATREAGDPLTGPKAHPHLTLHTRAIQRQADSSERRELLSHDGLGGLLGSDIKATGNSG